MVTHFCDIHGYDVGERSDGDTTQYSSSEVVS